MKIENQLIKKYRYIIAACTVLSLVFTSGCSDNDTTGPQTDQVSSLSIHPETASLEAGDQVDFSVVLLSATGEVLSPDDFDIEWQWWSTDPDVFTVEPGGLATGENPGEAYCMVEVVVAVSHKTNTLPDKLVVQAGILPTNVSGYFRTANITLTAENRELSPFENVSFKKEMRFNGRDSAFVVVF